MDEEMDWAAVSRMLDLTLIFELVVDRLDEGALSKHDLIDERHQLVLPIFSEGGGKLNTELRQFLK